LRIRFLLNHADEVPDQGSTSNKIYALFATLSNLVYPLVLGGDLKACRDPDVVYGDIDCCDKDCNSYFELCGFSTIG
jgi:hypothetical protein